MKSIPSSALESAIGHTFQRRQLLEQALTHSSHAREFEEHGDDNEQLEFLGDAVLGLVTSEELFTRFPQYKEGELSKLKAHLVSARHLIRAAHQLDLGAYLRLGRGEEKTGGRTKNTLLVDALEALVAALYLDAGMEVARRFILKQILEPELADIAQQAQDLLLADYKSHLQEVLHAAGRPEPEYVITAEEGPEHKKVFTVEVRIRNREGGHEHASQGQGPTKKRAGQMAAQQVLQYLESVKQPGDSETS